MGYGILFRSLHGLVGEENMAWSLVALASAAYASNFVTLPTCRCRLCCNAQDNARFDGHGVLTTVAAHAAESGVSPLVLQRLWRKEDKQALPEPGPSKFYVNEADESVLKESVYIENVCAPMTYG